MHCNCRLAFAGAAALIIVSGSLAFAQNTQDKPTRPSSPTTRNTQTPPGHQPDMQLPPGWTEADMQACMQAGAPGEMHQRLAEGVGVWTGKAKMWMAPDMEPVTYECTSTVTPLYEGRYFKAVVEGMTPMGPFEGTGIYGFNNVTEEFEATWIDSHSTGIMTGKGEYDSSGDALTWTYTHACPINKKMTTMTEIQRHTGPNTMTMEMHGQDPKTGKEFKMMEIAFERTGRAPAAPAATRPGANRPGNAPGASRGNDRPATAPGHDRGASPGMIADKKAEAGCAYCSYHMDGVKSCTLAVNIDGTPYLVTGSDVDVHQFCGNKGAKPAVVTGRIVDGKFVATNIAVQK